MDNQELISVIIPTYNRGRTIVSSVNSVLGQSYKNLEVIVVDDCSTDNTEFVLQNIHDERFIYHKLDRNRRACYARNYGYSLSHGLYIAFQDSDDVWHADKIEKQLSYMQKNKVEFVFCGMNRVLSDGRCFFYPTRKFDVDREFYYQELAENVVSTQTMFMKREVMENVKFDISFKRYQDWDFAIRVAKKYNIGYIAESLVDSFVQKDSVTSTINDYEALDHLYKKYENDIVNNSSVFARLQNRYGDSIRSIDTKKAYMHYKKSLSAKFDKKILCKALLSFLGYHF